MAHNEIKLNHDLTRIPSTIRRLKPQQATQGQWQAGHSSRISTRMTERVMFLPIRTEATEILLGS